MCSSELPPSPTTSLANFFHLLAFLLISALLSPSITTFKLLTNSCFLTIPFSPSLGHNPTSQISSKNLASGNWSAHCGKHTTGTPRLRLSRVEFQPQWVTKQPVAWWASNSSWLHHVTIRPLSFTKSLYPQGNLPCSDSLKTHKKLTSLSFNPQASSSTCSAFNDTMLPKEMYTTDRGAFSSSHLLHSSLSGFHRLAPYPLSPLILPSKYPEGTIGPIIFAGKSSFKPSTTFQKETITNNVIIS